MAYSVNEIIEAYKLGFEDGRKEKTPQYPVYTSPTNDNDKYQSWNYFNAGAR